MQRGSTGSLKRWFSILFVTVELIAPVAFVWCFWLSADVATGSRRLQADDGSLAVHSIATESGQTSETSKTEYASSSKYFPGSRVIVVKDTAVIRDTAGKQQRLHRGSEFKVRATKEDGELLVSSQSGEGRIAATDVMRIDQARPVFQGMVDKNPHDFHACFGLAKTWYYDDLTRAVPLFKEAIRLAPHNPAPYVYLGMAQGRMAGSEAARDANFDKAKQLSADDPWVLNTISYYWQTQSATLPESKLNDLTHDLERAIELSPTSGFPYSVLASILSRRSSPLPSRLSLAVADRGLQMESNHAPLHNLRGIYFLRLAKLQLSQQAVADAHHSYRQAEAAFDRSIFNDQAYEAYFFNRALAQWGRGDTQSSENVLVDLRLSALSNMNLAIWRNWRYIEAHRQSAELFGEAGSSKRNAYLLAVRNKLKASKGAEADVLRHLEFYLLLDHNDVMQGLSRIKGLDVVQLESESQRSMRMGSNLLNASLSKHGAHHDPGGDDAEESKGTSALDILCRWHPSAAIWALAHRADPNFPNLDGSRPIHTIVSQPNVRLSLLDSMIAFDADLEIRSSSGHTPLALALTHQNDLAARFLRVSGAGWGKASDTRSALSVVADRVDHGKILDSDDALDRWLSRQCELKLKEMMQSLLKWNASLEPLQAPKFADPVPYSSMIVDGVHPHEKARQQNTEFNRWYNDSQRWKKTQQQLQQLADDVQATRKLQFDNSCESILSWAALLVSPQFADELAIPLRK